MIEIRFENEELKKKYEGDALALGRSFYPADTVITLALDEKNEAPGDFSEELTVYDCRFENECVKVSCDGAETAAAFKSEGGERAVRQSFKRALYTAISDKTWKKLPWGCLTGVRPVGLVSKMLDSGLEPGEADEKLGSEYMVSKTKRSLALEVALRQRELISGVDKDGYSLYIGIPFCPTTCMYCSFTSYPIGAYGGMVKRYLDALYREMKECARIFDAPPATVYIGGGTPSALSAGEIDELLTRVDECFRLSSVPEITFEAGRPDSINEDKLSIIKDHGIDRISVNPQSMNDSTLAAIGRHHSTAQVREAFELARKLGFENINMDIILGLPEEGLYELERTMTALKLMDPESITVHCLAVKRASRFNEMLRDKSMFRLPEGVASNMNRLCQVYVRAMGMAPYYLYRQKQIADNFENVGYARDGKWCLYNIITMEETHSILALGAGAVSKRVFNDPERPGYIERCDNVREIAAYIERTDEMIQRKKDLFLSNTDKNPEG